MIELPVPLEVVIRGSDKLIGYACPKCGILRPVYDRDAAADRKRKHEEAVTCCMKTCACGNPREFSGLISCRACIDKKDAEREQAAFNKATKVLDSDYDGPVYWAGHRGGLGDGYFSGIDEILEYCADEELTVPEYVWACSRHPFTLDGEQLIERELERQEMYDDAGDDITEKARGELQQLLDKWTREQDLVSWNVDHSRAVLLQRREEATAASA